MCTGVSHPCHAGRINLSGWCFGELRACTTCWLPEMKKEGLPPPLNISLAALDIACTPGVPMGPSGHIQ